MTSASRATNTRAAPAPAPLLVADGAIEGMKWVAVVAMIADHVNKHLFNGALPGAFELGRLALPLFAFALAYNLARPGVIEGDAGKRIIGRLAVFALTATPAYTALGKLSWGWWPLNVLAMLLVATISLRLVVQGGTGRRALAVIVFLLAGGVVEFWWFGLACVGTAWRYAKAPTWLNAVLVVAATASLGLVNGNQWALAALPAAALLARLSLTIPRAGLFFYWFYPLHLCALYLLARW